MPSDAPTTSKHFTGLAGRRLIVTDLDLQQAEHRGIAAYSKSLLKALKDSGAEIWLLTDKYPRSRKWWFNHQLPQAVRMIELARILKQLSAGGGAAGRKPLSPASNDTQSLTRGIISIIGELYRLALVLARKTVITLLPRTSYGASNIKAIPIAPASESPYLNLANMEFLECVSGVISAKHLYANANRLAQLSKPRPVRLLFEGPYDALITTCPLNITVGSGIPLIQTVHDLIPLEYVEHSDHASVWSFVQRLASCRNSQNIYVSRSTMRKYRAVFGPLDLARGSVVIQPPSLAISALNGRLAGPGIVSTAASTSAAALELQPFKYILFNSSVESRKNVLFLIRAFRLSCLARKGIRLCIAGRLKRDAYSSAVRQEADDSVLLADYVSESTKAALFLNCMCVASPSLIEGFGIPVLDAACLGVQVLASPTESHEELRILHDFSDYIKTVKMHDPAVWATALNDICSTQSRLVVDVDVERQVRINRYLAVASMLSEAFRKTTAAHLCAAMDA